MDQIQHFTSTINDAYQIATSNLSNQTSIQKVEISKEELIKELNDDKYVKIPFVGDFSAGKSSLLNSYIGIQDFLPTDILPQTAVSYELYFSENEHLEVWEGDTLKETKPLSQLKSLETKPSCLVKVYINNDKIKALNDRHIIAVDMPGIDSGLEAHSNAIMNYIQEGTHFVVVTDIEQGTLRNSTIQFLNEIKKYGVDVSILLSKSDKKTAADIENIKHTVSELAQRNWGHKVFVGATSAANNAIDDLNTVFASVDADKLIEEKCKPQVELFINNIINELDVQIKLLLSNKENFTEKIAQLNEAKEKALNSLKEKNDEAQSVEGSTEDILNDINNALNDNASTLATALYSKQDSQQINATIVSIIRPVLINSFKREITEYQDVIGSSLQEFSLKVNDIINDKDNKILNGAEELIGNILGKDVLEGLLQKGLDKLAVKLIKYKGLSTLFKTIGRILGPIVTILIYVLPDLLRLIFGKSKETKINEIKQELINKVFGKITESLRPEIESMINEQRQAAQQSMADVISDEAQKYDNNINEIKNKQQANEQEIAQKVASLGNAIKQLQSLVSNV